MDKLLKTWQTCLESVCALIEHMKVMTANHILKTQLKQLTFLMYLLTICFVGMIFSQKALINFKYILQLISHPDCSKPFTTFYSFVIPTINPPIYPPSAAGSAQQLSWCFLSSLSILVPSSIMLLLPFFPSHTCIRHIFYVIYLFLLTLRKLCNII